VAGTADAPRPGATTAAGDLAARPVRWAAYVDAPAVPDPTDTELR